MTGQGQTEYIIAVDHGTSGIKCALMDIHGRSLDFAWEPTPVFFTEGGGSEQDPDDWYRALIAAVQHLVSRNRDVKEHITALCVSSTFSSTVFVDKSGRHLMNCLTWMDSRGSAHVKKIVGGPIEIDGYGLGAIVTWLPKTGGAPTLSGKDDIAHLLYVMHERPEVYEKTWKVLGSKDYLNLCLTGTAASTFDSMMLFWVVDTRDINNLRYDEKLIRRLGFDRAILPDMVYPHEKIGGLLPAVAEEMGVPAGIKVFAGSPDHQCSGLGAGAVRDFQGYLYIGTSSWLECVVPYKKTDILHSIASFPYSVPGKYFVINEQDIAGGAYSFLVKNILFHNKTINPADPPDDVYGRLNKAAESVPAGSGKLIFAPWLNGERTPVEDNLCRGMAANLSMNTTVDHLARAVMEGVAYNTRWMQNYVEKFIRKDFGPINMVGGGARSDLWCRIFADVMDREICRVKDPILANARGAAFIASVGMGRISYDDLPELVEFDESFTPDEGNRELYDDMYRMFLELYRGNRRFFRGMNG